VEQLGVLCGGRGREDSHGLSSGTKRRVQRFEKKSKPAPLKPKGAAPPRVKTGFQGFATRRSAMGAKEAKEVEEVKDPWET
jgi:hypothetical protein